MVAFTKPNRQEVRQGVGRLMGIMETDAYVYTTGLTITTNLAKLRADDFFQGWIAYFAQQDDTLAALATASSRTAGTITLVSIGATLLSIGTVELWKPPYNPRVINNLINDAIRAVDETVLVPKRVNPTSISANRRSLVIPGTLTHLSGMYVVDPDNADLVTRYHLTEDPAYFQEHRRSCSPLGTTLYLYPELPSNVTTSLVWLTGYGKPTQLSGDTGITDIRQDFLIPMVAFYLEAGGVENRSLDPKDHQGRAGIYLAEALRKLPLTMTRIDPNTMEIGP